MSFRNILLKMFFYFPISILLTPASAGVLAQEKAQAIKNIWGYGYNPTSIKKLDSNLKEAEELTSIPKAIQDKFRAGAVTVFAIDLDSDSRTDYIVYEKNKKTCYVDSSFKVRYCEKLINSYGFSYRWFVQLDEDPLLELLMMDGDEDSSDYKICKFDPTTWKRKILFRFVPMIISHSKDHNGIYWGYPWDVTGISKQIVTTPEKVKLLASIKYRSLFSSSKDIQIEDFYAEGGGLLPVIFFEGLPTQGEKTGGYNAFEKETSYVSLTALTKYYIATVKSKKNGKR